MRKSLPYEIAATLFAFSGAFVLVWPLREGVNLLAIGLGVFVLTTAWVFNVKAQALRKQGK
jgi:hypothetical protein